MKLTNLKNVLIHELEDLYSAENQIIKALPKMAESSTSPKLAEAFEEHLEQTRDHVLRLEAVAEDLEMELGNKHCKGMEGLLKEGEELLKEEPSPILDAALITAAQRVEHYEIAGYGSAVTFAKLLNLDDVADTLKETLAEEEETDKKLTKIAEKEVNIEAIEE